MKGHEFDPLTIGGRCLRCGATAEECLHRTCLDQLFESFETIDRFRRAVGDLDAAAAELEALRDLEAYGQPFGRRGGLWWVQIGRDNYLERKTLVKIRDAYKEHLGKPGKVVRDKRVPADPLRSLTQEEQADVPPLTKAEVDAALRAGREDRRREEGVPVANPDKRVPAELWERAKELLETDTTGVWVRLEACPDIVDEPAKKIHPLAREILDTNGNPEVVERWRLAGCPLTELAPIESAALDPTAQAVLDATGPWLKSLNREVNSAEGKLWVTVEAWDDAGRPTVVGAKHEPGEAISDVLCPGCGSELEIVHGEEPGEFAVHYQGAISLSPEDAATLAALNECRELGLDVLYVPTKPTPWRVHDEVKRGKWTFGETAPEALAAYKAAQAPEVKPMSEREAIDLIAMNQCPREPECTDWNDCITEWCAGCVARKVIRDRLPDRPESDTCQRKTD